MADIDHLFVPPHIAALDETDQQLKGIDADQTALHNYAIDTVGYTQIGTPERLSKIALKNAMGSFPGKSPVELAKLAKIGFEDLQAKYAKQIFAKQEAIAAAIDANAGKGQQGYFLREDQQQAIVEGRPYRLDKVQAMYRLAREVPREYKAHAIIGNMKGLPPEYQQRYEEILQEDFHKPFGEDDRSIFGKALYAIGTPSRTVAGGIAGALGAVREVAPAPVDLAQPAAPTFSARQPTTLTSAMNMGRAGSRIVTPKPYDEAPATGSLGSSLGVDLTQFAKVAAMNPGVILDVAKRAAKQTGQAFVGESEDQSGLYQHIAGVHRELKAAAEAQAEQEFLDAPIAPEALVEEKAARAKQLYQNALVNSALVDPNMAQLTAELLFDPLNIGAVAKAPAALAKGAWGAAKTGSAAAHAAVEGIPKIGPTLAKAVPDLGVAAGKLEEKLSYLPEAVRLSRAKPVEGMGAGADAASQMRLAEAEAAGTTAKSMGEIKTTYRQLADAVKAWPLEKRQEFYELANTKLSAKQFAALAPDMQQALELNRALGGQALNLKQTTGIGNRFETVVEATSQGPVEREMLRTAQETARENYVPLREPNAAHRGRIEFAKQTAGFSGDEASRAELQARSALKREGTHKDYEPDVILQWGKEIETLAHKAKSADEIRRLNKYLGGIGYSMRVPRTKRGAQLAGLDYTIKDEEILKIRERLSAQTGVEWEHLSGGINETWQRITGMPTQTKDDFVTIVPRDVAERVNALLPVLPNKKSAYQGLADFEAGVIRPAQLMWRVGKTVLGGVGYTTRNLAGAVGLGGIAHGLRAANPEIQLGAVAGALASAGIGEKTFRRLKLTVDSGDKIPLGDVIDAFGDMGMLDQHLLRMGLEQKATGPVGKVANQFLKVPEVLSPVMLPLGQKASAANINRAVENYQKLITGIGFIRSADDLRTVAGRARLLDLTSQFAGNYHRMNDFERTVMKDAFGFYSWARFIMPHIMRQIFEHPQRFTPWVKARGYLEHDNPRTYAREAMAPWLRDGAIMAPARYDIPKYGPKLGSHAHAVMMLEDPLWMGLSMLSLIDPNASARDPQELMGPAGRFLIEMATGRDAKTGDEIERFPWRKEDFTGLFTGPGWKTARMKAAQDPILEFLTSPIQRPTEGIRDLTNLYLSPQVARPGDAAQLQLRLRAGRNFGIFAKLLDALMIDEGEAGSLGSAVPGFSSYYANPVQQARAQSRRGMGKIPLTENKYNE